MTAESIGWQAFDPDDGDPFAGSPRPSIGTAGAVTVLAVAPACRVDGWAERAALWIVRDAVSRGERAILLDLDLCTPSLHTRLGLANKEGLTDAILYGSSMERITLSTSDGSLRFTPAGAAVSDARLVLASERWDDVLGALRATSATVFLFLPLDLRGAGELVSRTDSVTLLATEMEASSAGAGLAPAPSVTLGPIREPVSEVERGLESGVGVSDDSGTPLDLEEFGEDGQQEGSVPDVIGSEASDDQESSMQVDQPDDEREAGDSGEPEDSASEMDLDFTPEDEIGSSAEPGDASALDDLMLEGPPGGDLGTDLGLSAEVEATAVEDDAEEDSAFDLSAELDGPLEVESVAEPNPTSDVELSGLDADTAVQGSGGSVEAVGGLVPVQEEELDLDSAVLEVEAPPAPDPEPTPTKTDEDLAKEKEVAEAAAAPSGRKISRVWWAFAVLVAGGVGAWFAADRGLITIPGISAPEETAPRLVLPEVQTGRRPITGAQRYSLALDAYRDAEAAEDWAAALRERLPGRFFVLVPVEVDGARLFRVLMGPASTEAEANTLRDELAAVLTREDPTRWIVRETGFAFLMGEMPTSEQAELRIQVLDEAGVPSYTLAVEYADGTVAFRVYSGAYQNEDEAEPLQELLEEQNVANAQFTERIGRIPE